MGQHPPVLSSKAHQMILVYWVLRVLLLFLPRAIGLYPQALGKCAQIQSRERAPYIPAWLSGIDVRQTTVPDRKQLNDQSQWEVVSFRHV